MLKRLFIAVFVLSLVLGLSGTAISDVAKGHSALNPITPNVMSPERVASLTDARPAQPAFKKPAEALEAKRLPAGTQIPQEKRNYFCDTDFYYGSPTYFWTIPDDYGDDLFNTRFDTDPGVRCTLKVAWYLMYWPATAGLPDMKAYLWDDDGFGFPGDKLDSVTVLYADLDAAHTAAGGNLFWVGVQFGTEWVFEGGENYHLGFTTVDNSGAGTDMLGIISDDGAGPFTGEERSSEFYGGAWGTMLNDWGVDVVFCIDADRCCADIPYTDCYSQAYYDGLAYYWRAPHQTWGDDAYAEKFTVTGPETLVSVDVYIYNDGGAGGGTFGTNNVFITAYDDDAGLPGAQIEQVTLAPGSYVSGWNTIPFPIGTVISSDFHIAFSTDGTVGGDYESCLSDDGSTLTGRASTRFDTSGAGDFGWVAMADGWGADYDFAFWANMCKDEYADCSINFCYPGLAYYWQLPDRYGDFGQAQRFTGVGQECRVQNVDLLLYWNRGQYTWPRYTEDSELKVWADAGGVPGAELASVTITPADYGIATPTATASSMHWFSYDFEPMNITVAGAYWVGIISLASDTLTGISVLSNDGDAPGLGCTDGYLEYWGDWGLMYADWGFGSSDMAMVIESEHCCIPYSGRVCATPTEWSTLGGNMARDHATMVPMEDSWCDLSLNWHFEHPTNGVSFTGPVVFEDKVACSFGDEYRVFGIDGTPLYTYVPETNPIFAAGDIACAPTIGYITGYPDPIMFVAGGANGEVHAVNFNTGAMVWNRSLATVGVTGMYGNSRWGAYTVLTLGGADYVFWGTDDGKIVGVDALTGVKMTGYPLNVGQSTGNSGATDGTSLFFATRATGAEGDIYSVDPATATINWQLSATAGLQGGAAWVAGGGTYIGDEAFSAGVSYDPQRNYIYANSRVAGGNYPADGMFYRINAGSGTLAGPATLGNRTLYAIPVVDANRVYVAGFSRWASPPSGGDVYAVNKGTGLVDWAIPGGPAAFPYYCSGVLSCEPEPESDQLFMFGYDGFLTCLDANNGDELWRRRVESSAGFGERGMAGLLTVDGTGASHLMYADLWGNLFDLTKQDDRPRLEIQSYNIQVAVEFGAAASLPVTVPAIFTNTGCADLSFTSVAIDELEFGVDVPAFSASNVSADHMDRAAAIADQLSREAFLSKYTQPSNLSTDGLVTRDTERRIDRTAAGFPPFMNGILTPTVGTIIAPGDTIDLVMDVIQANVNRGPQAFYMELGTNDPDFFLNDPTMKPQMLITIVGGCLIDTTTLHFGAGGANEELVSNTGRLGNGDWGDGDAGHNGFLIDGNGAHYYQGSYVWATSTYRIATHTQDWTSGGGEADAFVSMQPDPNWCDNSCKPYVDAGVTLGYMSTDGVTYDPIVGNMVCKSFLDSVQNFDLGLGWDWTNFGAPFDNDSTMGLYAVGKTVGAVDVPELANVTLELLEITERNGQNVDGWYMGEFWDCDLGADLVALDRSISTAWCYNSSTNSVAFGQIKVPFGCGEEPMLNTFLTWGVSGSHGFWDWTQYWDTCFTMLSAAPGAYNFSAAGDEEAHVTIASHDFAPNETYKIGVGHFELSGLTDASSSAEFAPLAKLVNKWAGFGRGDVNNDEAINLADIIYLAGTVNGGPGAIPFQHLSDVNADDAIDIADVNFLIDYYFNCGPCPTGDFAF